MLEKMNRREFIKASAAIGVGSVLGDTLIPNIAFGDEAADIGVAKGQNYFENAKKAVELLGGMKKFVPKDSKVAILANPQRNNPGAFTKPEIVRAAVQMCKQAGAKEISCISWLPEENWKSTGLKKVVDEEGARLVITNLKDESLFKAMPVPKGKSLKEARIMNSFFDYDVFINMPISKDHAGNKYTGAMKNLMGINSPKSNRTFHKEDWTTNVDSIKHLEQCITDLNTIIKPDLSIIDSTEFITTNGPFGPGEVHKAQKVVAGTDPVALDSYCCTLWGLKSENIFAIEKAHEHGLGEKNLKKVNIKEVEV
ncbi:MAG: DUF362 domain-containing protein [Candidatus Latescibacteria bacterium]|nr:DUF362 domain-containing protein [Candidatus Latescibacterota bacterium]NIM22198.1 DUF362 domain-containing protein [Candidatus Latescibacterota bacterium]NIM66237.1 DUF362 domain-containing protein [Candidatus Latescibacterota bacterium]NIO02313.1 DUF362 domain-containing protein [Candidatus Latescibacterota bacterium]NIO29844.1 DUF362 domain-containing protein [Candidatus Latescibacterota bacterium]